MKRIRFILTMLMLVALAALCLNACGSSDEIVLEGVQIGITDLLTIQGSDIFGSVSNGTTEFSFSDNIQVAKGATLTVSRDKNGTAPVQADTVSLEIGNNMFYVTISNNGETCTYRINVRRMNVYTVTFDTSDGDEIASIRVEEGTVLEEPSYTLPLGKMISKWDYDFKDPVTRSMRIVGTVETAPEMRLFEFTSTETTCVITDYRDWNAKKISIPSYVTGIAQVAFAGCKYLTEIDIPEGVTFIGSRAFAECVSLERVSLPNSLIKIGEEAFVNCKVLESISIPKGVTYIADKAFYGCEKLNNVSIDGVFTMGSLVFYGCSAGLTTEYGNARYIGGDKNPYALLYSVKSTSATTCQIHKDTVMIAPGAFAHSKITSITIPDSVKVISSSFYSCNALSEVHITDLAAWCNITFTDMEENPLTQAGKLYLNGSLLTEAVIPEGVKEIGDYAFAECQTIEKVIINDSVTKIGDYAFSDCVALSEIKIGAGVKSIGRSAFHNCDALTRIDIPDSVTEIGLYAFTSSKALKHISFGNGLSEIDDSWFEGCTALESITPGKGIIYVYEGAFKHCSQNLFTEKNGCRYVGDAQNPYAILIKVTDSGSGFAINENTLIIGNNAFDSSSITSIQIPDSVFAIGDEAFIRCKKLKQITLGKGVRFIGERAFSECAALTEITLPDSVVTLGVYSFYKCTSLTSAKLSAGLTEIPGYTFYDCVSLTDIYIPSSITVIGSFALYGCDSLTEIALPEKLTSIGKSAFEGCNSLESIDIPDTVEDVGVSAFKYCWSMTSAKLPKGLKVIPEDAFYYCYLLTAIEIPEATRVIGDTAFYHCTVLTSITLPSYLRSIGRNAFGGCSALTEIIVPDSVITIGEYAFASCVELSSVVLPDKMTSAGPYLFRGDDKLTDVYYRGTKATFKKLNITLPDGCTMHDSYSG